MKDDAQPALHSIDLGEVSIAYAEWRRDLRGVGPTLLFVHGTSFHGRVWDEVIAGLPDYHAIAVDQRGHGRSTGDPVKHWNVFGQDLAGLIEGLDLTDIVGVAHSMGGHALLDAAASCQDRFRRIVVIDPMVAPPESYQRGTFPFLKPGEMHPAAKRKRHFASPEEMIERFRDRTPYSLFTLATLRNYCVHGLKPVARGEGYELACAPEMEASVYMASRTNAGIFDSLAVLRLPVLIIRARRAPRQSVTDFTSSPTWPDLVDALADARDVYRPDRTHFIPMEVPEEIATIVDEEVQAVCRGAAS